MPDTKHDSTQPDKFRDLARALECDESKEGFEASLRNVATPNYKAPKKLGLIVTGGEVLFFSSAKAAAGYAEAIDVEGGECGVSYDLEGRPYEFTVRESQVKVEPKSGPAASHEELRRILLEGMAHDPMVTQDWSLSDLLKRACVHLTY